MDEIASERQVLYLARLGFDGKKLTKNEASQRIERILQPIENAIEKTFRNKQTVLPKPRWGISQIDSRDTPENKERNRALETAIAHSQILERLPLFWPEGRSWEEQIKTFSGYDLTIDQQKEIVSIAHSVIETKYFDRLNCRNKEVQNYKESLPKSQLEPEGKANRSFPKPSKIRKGEVGSKSRRSKSTRGGGCFSVFVAIFVIAVLVSTFRA